jgi:hypothetical protein
VSATTAYQPVSISRIDGGNAATSHRGGTGGSSAAKMLP